MDIQTSSFNNQMLQAMKSVVEGNLNLTVGQKLPVNVVAINDNVMTLRWAGQFIAVENQNTWASLTPHLGQNITLQVTKTTPELEFKVIALNTSSSNATLPSAEKMNAMRLTLANAPLLNRIDESLRNFSNNLQGQHPMQAEVVGLVGNKIQLQLFIDDAQKTATSKKMLISIDPSQLQRLPSENGDPLRVGQSLVLAITKIGSLPEFKQLPTLSHAQGRDAQVSEYVKQLLPRHESSSVLFDQLRSNLPHMDIQNESLAQTLKQHASALFEHLQPKEQLFNPQKLKHLVYSSGIFFEANATNPTFLKSPTRATTSPTIPTAPPIDLKLPLLRLMQHEGVSAQVKQMTSAFLQGLLKQDANTQHDEAGAAGLLQTQTQLHEALQQLAQGETVPQSLKQLANAILPHLKTAQSAEADTAQVHQEAPAEPIISNDFKQDLFKLMTTLKQGLSQHRELELSKTQVESLKTLHNKTENALAKVVLDQLHSLPSDDSNKQLWAVELPFLVGNKVETLAMEIQREKTSSTDAKPSQNWSVNLTLSPPSLGGVQCVIAYQNGVINTHFKNQLPETTHLISKNLETLKQQLHNAGLISGLMTSNTSFKPLKSVYASMGHALLNETV
ncbi:MAG TPA: hypothetical protein DF614_00675 [Methylococcaceae bacterium]|nr:hypothetical protein [Methylococcaceae bacterium]